MGGRVFLRRQELGGAGGAFGMQGMAQALAHAPQAIAPLLSESNASLLYPRFHRLHSLPNQRAHISPVFHITFAVHRI